MVPFLAPVSQHGGVSAGSRLGSVSGCAAMVRSHTDGKNQPVMSELASQKVSSCAAQSLAATMFWQESGGSTTDMPACLLISSRNASTRAPTFCEMPIVEEVPVVQMPLLPCPPSSVAIILPAAAPTLKLSMAMKVKRLLLGESESQVITSMPAATA